MEATPKYSITVPQGIRSNWMLAEGWIAIVLGLGGSVAGSGGTMAGFFIAVILNPVD